MESIRESTGSEVCALAELREARDAREYSGHRFPVPKPIAGDPQKLRTLSHRVIDKVIEAGNLQWLREDIESSWELLEQDGQIKPSDIPAAFADLVEGVDLAPYTDDKQYLLDHVERLCKRLDQFGMNPRLVIPRLIDVLCRFDVLRLKLFWEGRMCLDDTEVRRLGAESDAHWKRKRQARDDDESDDAEPEASADDNDDVDEETAEVAAESDVKKVYIEKRIRLIHGAVEGIGPLRIADLELVHAFVRRCNHLEPDEDDSSSEIARSVAAEIAGGKQGDA